MKKIIITGCAGFIGSKLAEKLIETKNFVFGIDSFHPYYKRSIKEFNISKLIKNKNFQFLELDVRKIDKNVFKNKQFDLCVHLASTPGVLSSINDEESYLENNVNGTINLLKNLALINTKKLIFASSSTVYKDEKKGFFDENKTPTKPLSPYGRTKLRCEELIKEWSNRELSSFINLRFFSVYGPSIRPDLAIYKFTDRINNNIPLSIFGDGSSQRDYTHIDDIIKGLLLAVNYITKRNNISATFNLGNGNPIRLIDLIKIIEKKLSKKAIIEYLPFNDVEMYRTCASLKLVRDKLNYQPTINIENGIDNFIEWYKKNHILYNY